MTLVDEVAGAVVARVNAILARFTRNIEEPAARRHINLHSKSAEPVVTIFERVATFQFIGAPPHRRNRAERMCDPKASGRPGSV
jgi:hypothetical protein